MNTATKRLALFIMLLTLLCGCEESGQVRSSTSLGSSVSIAASSSVAAKPSDATKPSAATSSSVATKSSTAAKPSASASSSAAVSSGATFASASPSSNKDYLSFDNGTWLLKKGDWGKEVNDEDVLAVLQSVLNVYYDTFGKDYVLRDNAAPKVVQSLDDYPRTHADLTLIYLKVEERYWCQYMYQFGHELYHFTTRDARGNGRHQWFEESICEVSSLYVLDVLAETWKTNPPYASWKDYATAIREYYQDCLEGDDIGLTRHELVVELKQQQKQLETEPFNMDRRVINAFSPVMYRDVFQNKPQAWDSLKELQKIGQGQELSFEEYINTWHKQCTGGAKEAVRQIASIFEVELVS